MYESSIRHRIVLLIAIVFTQFKSSIAQTNLLLNGGFEDVNTCTEYSAECGVEGWFYLKDVKAQMLGNETNTTLLGTNSLGIFYNWIGYTDFTPIIGAILPCGLQKYNRYTFKGIISAKLNPKLILKAGICLGQKFYVPRRPFSKEMKPDSITSLEQIPATDFYQFEYTFTATGDEKYLTFGSYIAEDTVGGKKKVFGAQSVSIVLDNFQLIPENKLEITCADFIINKEAIYNYNFRHKEMDYSLFGKGELAISFKNNDSNSITHIQPPPPPVPKSDTLKLGDVFFDFNKANLKKDAFYMLEQYFIENKNTNSIDSIYVEGHTDSVGTDSRNLQLSRQRCESITTWLRQNNIISPERIHIYPFGESKPIATNSTSEGRALNRRVEMIVFRNPEK